MSYPAAVAGGAATTEARPVLAAPRAAAVVVAVGCALLALRPLWWHHSAHPDLGLVVLFLALLVAGWAWPVQPRRQALDRATAAMVLALGVGAFALGRLFGEGHPPSPLVARVLLANTLAAVAEEAFFRRLAYGVLAARGTGAPLAVAGSALLFALVHVTVYGAWVLPIDLAAGLVLGWQRWASGTWAVPAVTHVLANVMVVM